MAAPAVGAASATSRFAAACGALSQFVKAAAEAERVHARHPGVPVTRPLPLMPGADIDASPDLQMAQAQAQMTIVYGGRVLVLGGQGGGPAWRRLAAAATAAAAAAAREGEGAGTEATAGAKRGGQGQVSVSVSVSVSVAADLLPVARKASLQRFMEKRKVRVAARAEPYRRPDASDDACPDHLKLKLAL